MNRIPRQFNRIVAKQLQETSGGKSGDIWHVYRNLNGLLGLNTRTGKYFYMFASHLRMREFYEFVSVEKYRKVIE